MTTINLIFNDNITVPISATSFLFKHSDFLKSFDLSDLEEDIYIICSSSYILDESNNCLFNEKDDLTFMFKLEDDKFINMCLFLDIISYDQPTDNKFSKEFIKYVMNNKIILSQTLCFMNKEIRSINNYNNDADIDIQMRTCDINFYELYLQQQPIYADLIIKHNRIDIYNLYYRYNAGPKIYQIIHKYNNNLSNNIKNTKGYNHYIKCTFNKLYEYNCIKNIDFLIEIGKNLNIINNKGENILFNKDKLNIIKFLIEKQVPIIQNKDGNTILHKLSYNAYYNDCESIKYILENVNIDINIQNNDGNTMMHLLCMNNSDNINYYNCIKYIIDSTNININIKNNNGYTSLYYLYLNGCKDNCNNIIKYITENTNNDINNMICNNTNNIRASVSGTILHKLCEYFTVSIHTVNHNHHNVNDKCYSIIHYIVENTNININIQDDNGYTALIYAANNDNLELVKYLIEHGANVRLKTNKNKTAYSLGNIDIKQYIQSIDLFYKRYQQKLVTLEVVH